MHLKTVHAWKNLPPEERGASVALGNFDGVHRGHQQVIAQAAKAALEGKTPLGVISFDPHPRRLFRPTEPAFKLMTHGQQARALGGLGVDLLEISGGTYETATMFQERKSESTRAREAFFLDFADTVRAHTRVPLLLTGGFRTLEGMDAALSSGAIDVVGLARPLAVEPDLPARLLSGESTAARPIKLSTGWKKLDALVQATWYQAQLVRLARGEDPSATLCRTGAILRIGDLVKAIVARVDLARRELDLSITEVTSRARKGPPGEPKAKPGPSKPPRAKTKAKAPPRGAVKRGTGRKKRR